jgi:hypothetical protein
MEGIKGLSLGLNTHEVIIVGDTTLVYYVTDKGQKRLKIIAPDSVQISRLNREDYIKYAISTIYELDKK